MGQVMIDIETLGRKPGCRVIQIGAVAFSLARPFECEDSLILNIDQFDPESMLFSVDEVTKAWWHDQSARVKETWQIPDKNSLRYCLEELGRFIQTNDSVWAKPVSFDLSIIRACYERLKMKNPWHWQNEMDARTAYQLLPAAGRDYVNGELVEFRETMIEHYALDDAMEQAWAVQLGMKWMRDRVW